MKKKRKGAWKRILASVLGMVLVVVLTIVGTLAFLQTKSNEKTNVFTGSNDIKLYLEEPSYNLRELKDANGNVTGYELRDANALDPREYVPGMTYPKDPTLYNVTGKQQKKSDNSAEYAEEWVAIRVDYAIDADADGTIEAGEERTCADMSVDYVVGGQVTTPAGIISPIDFNDEESITTTDVKTTGGWIKITPAMCSLINANDKYDIYVYKCKLKAAEDFNDITNDTTGDNKLNNAVISTGVINDKTANGSKTTPLFESITIKDQATLKTNGYDISNLKKFTIKLTGAAIKVMPTIDIENIVKDDLKTEGGTSNTTSEIIVNDLVSLLVQQ